MPKTTATTAATLARAWNRTLPSAIASFLGDTGELLRLEKLRFTLRYGGDPKVSARFVTGAFADLADWMEGVGLGDDIDWPNEPGDYQHRLPIALLKARTKGAPDQERNLLTIDTAQPGHPIFLWTEGTFIALFPSLQAFLDELEGRVEDPLAILQRAVAQAGCAVDYSAA